MRDPAINAGSCNLEKCQRKMYISGQCEDTYDHFFRPPEIQVAKQDKINLYIRPDNSLRNTERNN